MGKFRLDLGHLNVAELIALAQQVHFAMYDNSAFAALKSQIGRLLDEVNEMIIANDGCQEALQTVHHRLAERQGQRSSLENLLNELAIGVERISGRNPGMIPSAGFDVPALATTSASLRTQVKLPVGMEGVAAAN